MTSNNKLKPIQKLQAHNHHRLPVAAIIQAVVSTYLNRYELIDSDLLRDHDPDTPE